MFGLILDRATTTSTDDVDLLAIDLFATMVQQYEAFITLDATKIIAEKFKSNSTDEVLLALNVNIYTSFTFHCCFKKTSI